MNIKQIGFKDVDIKGGFLRQIEKLNEEVTINAVYDRFNETGRIRAFSCTWKEGDPDKPHIFWDSDVAKWMEGASYILAKHPDEGLTAKIESVIDDIKKNQWEDGYVNSYYTAIEPQNRFTVRGNHELYCCGHLIEAAIAYYEATGRDRFLKIMMRYADLIDRIFRVERSAAFLTPGHEEIEIALFRLYRCTKIEKYLKLAEFFVDARGDNDIDGEIAPGVFGIYQQDVPPRKAREAVGHSVRACYFYASMADYALETGDEAMAESCREIWNDIACRKMYITGGIGSTSFGEAFTIPYDLPPESAYTETCAGIALIYFSQRMFLLRKESKYADVIERLLYNGVISGLSLSGDCFFYENPLEINLRNHYKIKATANQLRLPITQRVKVFGCSCCPPNLNRLLASVGDYIYAIDGDELYVNQFATSSARSGDIEVKVETDYPLSGKIKITAVNTSKIRVRIPSWCKGFSASADHYMEKGYAVFSDNSVTIDFDMPVNIVCADSRVWDNAGKVAVIRGPVVYCAEGTDNDKLDLHTVYISSSNNKNAAVFANSPSGLPELELDAKKELPSESGELYFPAEDSSFEKFRLHMIPYFSFANRGEDDMLIWFNRS